VVKWFGNKKLTNVLKLYDLLRIASEIIVNLFHFSERGLGEAVFHEIVLWQSKPSLNLARPTRFFHGLPQ